MKRTIFISAYEHHLLNEFIYIALVILFSLFIEATQLSRVFAKLSKTQTEVLALIILMDHLLSFVGFSERWFYFVSHVSPENYSQKTDTSVLFFCFFKFWHTLKLKNKLKIMGSGLCCQKLQFPCFQLILCDVCFLSKCK